MQRIHIVTRQIDKNTTSAEPVGEIDLHTSPEVKKALHELIDHGGHRDLIINLEKVSFIDSSGLAVLFGVLDHTREKEMRVVVICSTPSILRVLKLTGLTEVLHVCNDESQALQTLEGEV